MISVKAAAKRYAKQGAELSHQKVLHKSLTARNKKLQASSASLMTKVRHGASRIAELEKKVQQAAKAAARSFESANAAAAKAVAAKRKAAAAQKATNQALAVRASLQKVKKKVKHRSPSSVTGPHADPHC